MSAEENKALMRRFFDEVVNAGKMELIDQLVSADFVEHEEFPGLTPGREGVKQFFTTFRAAFPDLRMTVEDMLAEGDKVAARVTMSGTHRGEFMGMAPTGKRFSVTAIDVVRFAGGKAVEHWGQSDNLGMMQQLGAVPPMG